MRLAEVIINRPSKQLNRTFTYEIPETWQEISAGWRVVVPFGPNTEEGIIIDIHEGEPPPRVKPLLRLLGDTPWLTEEMLATAAKIADYYVCTKLDALRLFFQEKQGIRRILQYELLQTNDLTPADAIGKKATWSYWQKFFPDLQAAIRDGYLQEVEKIVSTLERKQESILTCRPAELIDAFGQKKKQQALYAYLQTHGDRSRKQLLEAGFSRSVIQDALHNQFIAEYFQPLATQDISGTGRKTQVELNSEQEVAVRSVAESIERNEHQTFLLHGVTGSGKTEVYLRLAEIALEAQKTVLVLVPEISLTPQMMQRLVGRFGENVVAFHSGMTEKEKRNNRQRILLGESRVVVGPRSALFSPLENIGLIVIDEEYDSSYKQEETPRYHALQVAKWRAEAHHCPLVLGAATPSVTTYYQSEIGKIRRLELPHRIDHTPLPKVEIVDMRNELEIGNRSILSREMRELVENALRQRQQIILLMNRRGYATYVFCRQCGHVMKCPHCDTALTYHFDTGKLLCHHCEHSIPLPQHCPACGSTYIKYFGMGVQKAMAMIQEYYPQARIRRLDRDVLAKENIADLLAGFEAGEADILIGTQLVAKGHDLPNVIAVGILSADNALHIPNYTSAEKVFSLITQAAGRAGRKKEQGRAVLQTYHPDHYAIRHAANHDYRSFYEEEINLRQIFGYPPFAEMMKVTTFAEGSAAAENACRDLYMDLQEFSTAHTEHMYDISEPFAEFHHKLRDRFYVSMIVKGRDLSSLKQHIRNSRLWQRNGIIIDIDTV